MLLGEEQSGMVIGYTTGVYDLFHIGHLNILRNSRAMCDRLIVGVTTDELMLEYKKKRAVIPFGERCEILRALTCVDAVIAQHTLDKLAAWERLRFDVMFVGDDWYSTSKWEEIQRQLEGVGVRTVYFPYTRCTSSTLINDILIERREQAARKSTE